MASETLPSIPKASVQLVLFTTPQRDRGSDDTMELSEVSNPRMLIVSYVTRHHTVEIGDFVIDPELGFGELQCTKYIAFSQRYRTSS